MYTVYVEYLKNLQLEKKHILMQTSNAGKEIYGQTHLGISKQKYDPNVSIHVKISSTKRNGPSMIKQLAA